MVITVYMASIFSFFKRVKKNYREFPREQAREVLAVYDEDQTIMLGRIIDLSIGGMLVASEFSIQIGNDVRLAIEIPQPNGDTETLWMRCKSVRQDIDEKTGACKIGFHFTERSPGKYKIIAREKSRIR